MAASSVDAYLDALEHTHLAAIRSLRGAIVAADPRIVERIKWNAPSFGLGDDDLVTMRLAPKDAFQLVFHRGVAKRTGSVTVDDPGGLLDWKAPDRAVVDLTSADQASVVALVRAWIAAAAPAG
jgi:hypothetical protein